MGAAHPERSLIRNGWGFRRFWRSIVPGIHSARYQTDRANKRAEWKAQKRKCAICGQLIDYDLPKTDPEHFQLDHIKSRRQFPELENVSSNWQPAHASCNKKKGQGSALAELGETSEVW